MFSVEADKATRFIVLSVVGHVTTDEVKLAAQRVRELVENAAPGFQVLTDLRWLESMPTSASQHVAEIMDALAKKKVGSIARVVPDPRKDIGLNILSQFHYGSQIQAMTFETMADALQSLVEQSAK